MKRIAVIILLLSIGCGTTNLRRESSMLVGTTALDVATSRVAIQRGGVEANPVLKNQAVSLAVNTVLTYAIVRYSSHLKERGVRNWYMPMRIWSAIHLSAAGWNLMEMR